MNEPTTRHVTTPTSATCAHCGRPFTVDRRSGPSPRYCRRSCRQRAYEARAALGDPTLAGTALAGTVAVTHDLDAGLSSRGRAHALDPASPDPRPDGTRPTLCGTRARPSQRPFTPSAAASCRRCARAAPHHTIVDHIPARALTNLLAAAHDTTSALPRAHDELALRLTTAILKLEQHLSRDKQSPPSAVPSRTTPPVTNDPR